MRDKELSLAQQYLIGIGLLVFTVFFAIFIFLYLAIKPDLEGRQEAETIARTYAGLEQVTRVDFFNGQEAYYSLTGQDAEGDLLVLVNKETQAIHLYRPSEGISQEEAKSASQSAGASQISQVIFGYDQDRPIWEVQADGGYYIIDFKTGAYLKKEGL